AAGRRRACPRRRRTTSAPCCARPGGGGRAGREGAERQKGSEPHAAVDALGRLLALRVTPAGEQDRPQVAHLAAAVQEAAGESVELAHVDRGCAGAAPAEAARADGTASHVGRAPDAKRGSVPLPRRWAVERSFACAARFGRLARGYERPPQTVAGLHFVAFACLMLAKAAAAFGLVRNTV
ncbi:transposase, partial [Craurococcus roseus]|uniref:transposase n=1 Tax=Craurococcus roseus TaxID=77585 RepID=UPI0031E4059F